MHESKVVRDIIIIIGIIIVALSILFIGISIGARRARFAGDFRNNFERNIKGPTSIHGAVGQILSVNLPQIIITGPDNLEKTVLLATSTVVRQFQQNIQNSVLKVGDLITVIGDPNANGQIEAKFIRVMPN